MKTWLSKNWAKIGDEFMRWCFILFILCSAVGSVRWAYESFGGSDPTQRTISMLKECESNREALYEASRGMTFSEVMGK